MCINYSRFFKIVSVFLFTNCFIFIIGNKTYGQDIGADSKGKSIFTFYSLNDYRLEFDTKEPLSIAFSGNRIRTTFTRNADTTIVKLSGFVFKTSVLNSGESLALSNLSQLKPGIGLKAGYQKSIEKFNNIKNTPSGTYSTGINAIFNMDNIMLYNTAIKIEEKKYPLTYGVELNYSHYSKKMRIISLNTSLLRTWNKDKLVNYQTLSNAVIDSNVVSFKEFAGRYGQIENQITQFRFSASFPFYWKYLNPIPYVVFLSSTGSIPQYFVGINLNILNKPLGDEDFSIPSSIGVGIDWVYSGTKFSQPNIFLRGAINFGKFK